MNTLTEDELRRLVDMTFVDQFELFESIGSTNDRAKELARDAPDGVTLVVTKRQVAGRGRGHNRWASDEGSLTFSLLLPPGFRLPQPAGTTSLWSAIAICEAVGRFVSWDDCGVKWPNDVLIKRRKVGGLLLETVKESLVIGVGLNVATTLESDLLPGATSLTEHVRTSAEDAKPRLSMAHVLFASIESLHSTIAKADCSRLPRRWCQRDMLAGMTVTVNTPTERIFGKAIGVDERGSLLIETTDGIRATATGTVDWNQDRS